MSDAEALNQQANQLFLKNKFKPALEKYTRAIAADPTVAKYHGNRAQCNLSLSAFAEAEVDAKKAIELDSSNSKFHYRLASALLSQSKFNQAIAVMDSDASKSAASTAGEEFVATIRALRMKCEKLWITTLQEGQKQTFNVNGGGGGGGGDGWWRGMSEDAAYKWFATMVVLNVEDTYCFSGDLKGAYLDGANGDGTHGYAYGNFKRMHHLAEKRKELPPWWDRKKAMVAGKKLAPFAMEKHDVVEEYDVMTPMMMRALAQSLLQNEGARNNYFGGAFDDDDDGDEWYDEVFAEGNPLPEKKEKKKKDGKAQKKGGDNDDDAVVFDDKIRRLGDDLATAAPELIRARYAHVLEESLEGLVRLPRMISNGAKTPAWVNSTVSMCLDIVLITLWEYVSEGVKMVAGDGNDSTTLLLQVALYRFEQDIKSSKKFASEFTSVAKRRLSEFAAKGSLCVDTTKYPTTGGRPDGPFVGWKLEQQDTVGALEWCIYRGVKQFAVDYDDRLGEIYESSIDRDDENKEEEMGLMPLRLPGQIMMRVLPSLTDSPFKELVPAKGRHNMDENTAMYELYSTVIEPLMLNPADDPRESTRRIHLTVENGFVRYIFPKEMFEEVRGFIGKRSIETAAWMRDAFSQMAAEGEELN